VVRVSDADVDLMQIVVLEQTIVVSR